MTKGLSIIIPILNEADNIIPLLSKMHELTNKASFKHEFILVDGNSTDNTMQILKDNIGKNNENIFIYSQDQSYGYGSDIFFGLTKSKYSTLSWTHADLQTELLDLIEGYSLYEREGSESIVFKGSRIKRPFLDTLLTFLMSVLTFILLREWIMDINGQPKIFSRKIFNEIFREKNYPIDFSFDLFFLISAIKNNIKIKTFNVGFKQRLHGIAKGGGGSLKNRLKLINRTMKYIYKLRVDYKINF